MHARFASCALDIEESVAGRRGCPSSVTSFASDAAARAGWTTPFSSRLFSLMKTGWHGLCEMQDARRAGAVPRMRVQSFHFVEESHMKKLMAVLMVLAMGILAGCNTMEGLGKDVQRGGEKVEGAADRNR
jgi:entericidin B